MATIFLPVYDAGRAANAGVNFSDNLTVITPADTCFIPNNGRVGLLMSGAGSTVTVQSTATSDGNAVMDAALPVTAQRDIWGGFPPHIYNDANGYLVLTVSANTSIIAFRLG